MVDFTLGLPSPMTPLASHYTCTQVRINRHTCKNTHTSQSYYWCVVSPCWNTSHFLTALDQQHSKAQHSALQQPSQSAIMLFSLINTHTHVVTLPHPSLSVSPNQRSNLQNWSGRTFSSHLSPTTSTSPSLLQRPSCAPLTFRDKWR